MAREPLLVGEMEIDVGAAALAGLVGGGVMLSTRLLLRLAGAPLRMDVTLMWSSMLRMRGGSGRAVGVAMHLVVSAVVGLIYAAGVRLLFGADDALWLWGVLGGVIHYMIAGAFLAIAPEMNSEMPERIPAPGVFAAHLGGADVGAFLLAHLAYGVSFGIAYASLHPAGGIGTAF